MPVLGRGDLGLGKQELEPEPGEVQSCPFFAPLVPNNAEQIWNGQNVNFAAHMSPDRAKSVNLLQTASQKGMLPTRSEEVWGQ